MDDGIKRHVSERSGIPIAGGCLCGAIRFESTSSPIQGYYCHCTICQRAYGGLFSATLRDFQGSAFGFTKGEPRYYRVKTTSRSGASAPIAGPQCLSLLMLTATSGSIGSLDHPEDWSMTKDASWGLSKHWFVNSKIAWEEITDGLLQLKSELNLMYAIVDEPGTSRAEEGAGSIDHRAHAARGEARHLVHAAEHLAVPASRRSMRLTEAR